MSEIVAIITEYNPFHNGHKYQIDKIREQINDATIIAIMSGNAVQRGDFAFANKYSRAKCAIECGVDAVFELPFPYSCSTAEIFASAGVEIASKLGADYLYFGIEASSVEEIEKIADTIDTKSYNDEISALINEGYVSYPIMREIALKKLGFNMSNSSNDILAIEYIRAIKNKRLNLKYRAVKRTGAHYKDKSVCDIMSASAIRDEYYKNGKLLSLPKNAEEILNFEAENGLINDKFASNRILHSSIILNSPISIEKCFDVTSGMGYYLYDKGKKCKNITSFTDELSSKCYTTARLKRAVLYSMFNVVSIDKEPKYTVLLGANEKGKKVIKANRKKENFIIITKYSDSKKLDKAVFEQYEKSLKLDEIYETLCIEPKSPKNAYMKTPYIK